MPRVDTAALYDSVHDIRLGDAFIFVYSTASRESFEDISGHYQHVLTVKKPDTFQVSILPAREARTRIPAVVVASKCDLDSQREVSTDGT